MPNPMYCSGRRVRQPLPHQDEFPAEYSLASCSPAALASASSATLILHHPTPVRPHFFGERQLSPNASVSSRRAPHWYDPSSPAKWLRNARIRCKAQEAGVATSSSSIPKAFSKSTRSKLFSVISRDGCSGLTLESPRRRGLSCHSVAGLRPSRTQQTVPKCPKMPSQNAGVSQSHWHVPNSPCAGSASGSVWVPCSFIERFVSFDSPYKDASATTRPAGARGLHSTIAARSHVLGGYAG